MGRPVTWNGTRPASAIYATPQHKAARRALLARYQPGDPCCLCGHAMYPPTRNLDADHLPGTDSYRGLAHGNGKCQVCGKRCNRSDGARRGRARQNVSRLRL